MQYVLLTLLSLALYVGGLIMVLRSTPRLLMYAYHEWLFMGIAAIALFGAILAFGAVVIILYEGGLLGKAFGFLLVIGIAVVAGRVSFFSSRATAKGIHRASRIIAFLYGLSLVVAALYYIVYIFKPS